jgi:hypothetical protein
MNDTEVKSIKVWMRQVMQQTGMSANEWATKAGTSPTNITRFLNSDCKFVPSARTIAKLSSVSRSQPSFGQIPTVTSVPVLNAEGVVVDMINDPKIGKVYGQAGIFSWSYVVVAECKKPVDGDVLLIKDDKHGLLVGEFYEGLLLFRNSDHLVNQERRPRKIKNVEIVGKVIQSIQKYD